MSLSSDSDRACPQAVRHLEAYSFPGNVTELEAIVMRATAQVAPGAEVNADVFWFASQVRASDTDV